MRYVSIEKLREGMVLGVPLYGLKFEVLLAEGMKLTGSAVRRINEMGYAGVYIQDDRFIDVSLRYIVPPELRVNTIRSAKEFLEQAQSGFRSTALSGVTKDRQEKVIMPLIHHMIRSSLRVLEVMDLKPYNYYSYYHAADVVLLSLAMGLHMGIAGTQLYELGMAALLHDVGNAFVPSDILEKRGNLTPGEYEIVQKHSEKGFDYLRANYDISIEACTGALQHHERFDGTGYPGMVRGEKISIIGRIIAVADTYDAMVSRRPYRPALQPPEALAHMRQQAGKAFDPRVVEALEQVVAPYPTGVQVELDDGTPCLVVANYPDNLGRPLLRSFDDPETLYIDLRSDEAYRESNIARIL